MTDLVIEDIPLSHFCKTSGISRRAAEGRIARGDWLENYEFFRKGDGTRKTIFIHLPGYYRWTRGQARIKVGGQPA